MSETLIIALAALGVIAVLGAFAIMKGAPMDAHFSVKSGVRFKVNQKFEASDTSTRIETSSKDRR